MTCTTNVLNQAGRAVERCTNQLANVSQKIREELGHTTCMIGNRLDHPGTDLRIWSRGAPQLPWPKVANIAEQSCASEASYLQSGSRAHLRVRLHQAM